MNGTTVSTPRRSTAPSAPRMIQLDILRGLAILLVLGHHQFYKIRPDSQPYRFCYELASKVGWTGVDLFFVLSGFLIGSLLFNEMRDTNALDVKRFLIRRGLKIWPAYYALIAYAFCAQYARVPLALDVTGMPVRDSAWSAFRGVAANLLNVQNYLPTIRVHTWSLAVEEHFYVLLPFLLLALTRRARATGDWSRVVVGIPVAGVVLFVGCNLVRFQVAARTGGGSYATHARIDELFAGVVLAYANCFWPGFLAAVRRRRAIIGGAGLAWIGLAVAVVQAEVRYQVPIATDAVVFGSAAILIALLATPPGEGWLGRAIASPPARWVAWIGTYSYAIYLWHLDFAFGPLNWLYKTGAIAPLGSARAWVICSVLYVFGATMAGVGMSRLIEFPVLRFRERFFPRPVPVVTRDEAALPVDAVDPMVGRPHPGPAVPPRLDLAAS